MNEGAHPGGCTAPRVQALSGLQGDRVHLPPGEVMRRRRRGQQRMRWLDGISDSMDVSLSAETQSATLGDHMTKIFLALQ